MHQQIILDEFSRGDYVCLKNKKDMKQQLAFFEAFCGKELFNIHTGRYVNSSNGKQRFSKEVLSLHLEDYEISKVRKDDLLLIKSKSKSPHHTEINIAGLFEGVTQKDLHNPEIIIVSEVFRTNRSGVEKKFRKSFPHNNVKAEILGINQLAQRLASICNSLANLMSVVDGSPLVDSILEGNVNLNQQQLWRLLKYYNSTAEILIDLRHNLRRGLKECYNCDRLLNEMHKPHCDY